MKALLATLIAGGFVLLTIVALELVSIRRSLRRIERDDRQLVVVIQRNAESIHPVRSVDAGTRFVDAGHAAALALPGWYLMVPPAVSTSPKPNAGLHFDDRAPLSKWDIWGSYDSAKGCMDTRVSNLMTIPQAILKSKNPNARAYFSQNTLAQCIASDDPRLKK
jgi:hypothetical protein